MILYCDLGEKQMDEWDEDPEEEEIEDYLTDESEEEL